MSRIASTVTFLWHSLVVLAIVLAVLALLAVFAVSVGIIAFEMYG